MSKIQKSQGHLEFKVLGHYPALPYYNYAIAIHLCNILNYVLSKIKHLIFYYRFVVNHSRYIVLFYTFSIELL